MIRIHADIYRTAVALGSGFVGYYKRIFRTRLNNLNALHPQSMPDLSGHSREDLVEIKRASHRAHNVIDEHLLLCHALGSFIEAGVLQGYRHLTGHSLHQL